MGKDWRVGALVGGGALLGLGIAYVLYEKSTPEPNYRVLASENDLEIRSYPAITVAETVVTGERKKALNDGYRLLAAFLKAASVEVGENLPMRVPVFQDAGNPMGSDPPLFDDAVEGGWRVRLTLPDDHPIPEPAEGIAVVEVPARRVGVVTFNGTANDDRLVAAEDRLRGWLARHGEECQTAEPEYAFYNSPMIPPPLRRNEVLLSLA